MSLSVAEQTRAETLSSTKADLGQFFTPAPLARLVVSRLRLPDSGVFRVLDLGAGVGALSAAVAERVANEVPDVRLELTCVEVDAELIQPLRHTLRGLDARVIEADALDLVARGGLGDDFDAVVMNPPYGKLAANSAGRAAVAQLGTEVPNLYAAFMVAGYVSLAQGGQLAAIVPRSWANGTYFRRFRLHFFEHLSLDHIQTFASRSTLFSEAKVLQENVIITATRGTQSDSVVLTADAGPDVVFPLEQVVMSTDPTRVVRMPTGGEREVSGAPLASVGLSVATGKVVDFRSRDRLVADTSGAHPLIYPGNISGGRLVWPRQISKAQSFNCDAETEFRKFLHPVGWYVVVKRFSSKEERRRLVAAAHEAVVPTAFENHTNVIACPSRDVAVGLALWLNSTALDGVFRAVSGHTQVNAGDLRSLPYPTLDQLAELGNAHEIAMPDQAAIDEAVEAYL